MAVTLSNDVTIACSVRDLFDYVTQPWCWHQWHPNSKSASAENAPLTEGDYFDEIIEVAPFSPLPPRLRRETRYRVLHSQPGKSWSVGGQLRDGWLNIRYDFQAVEGGVQFHRELTFDVSGPTRLLLPVLRRRMASTSEQALARLKHHMENA